MKNGVPVAEDYVPQLLQRTCPKCGPVLRQDWRRVRSPKHVHDTQGNQVQLMEHKGCSEWLAVIMKVAL